MPLEPELLWNIFLSFIIAPVAFIAAFEVVVLARGALPAALRELEIAPFWDWPLSLGLAVG